MALNEHMYMEDGSLCGSGGGGGAATHGGSWRLRQISWVRVLGQQDWGSVLSTVIVLVALRVVEALLGGPRSRPFMVIDATISFPNGDSTIPYWCVVVASLAALLLTVTVAELWLVGRTLHADLADALAAALHFAIDGVSAFLVTGMVTQISKMVVGRLRPDFLDRCQPGVPSPLSVQYGLPPADNPACTAAESGELTDGHYSFPSGHTSTAFVFSVWTVGYSIWAFSLRPPRTSAAAVRKLGLGRRLAREAATASAFLWIVALLVYAWFVGVSRIVDFKHHPSDVAAGAMLGTLFGAAFVVRAIARLGGVVMGLAETPSPVGTPQPEISLLQSGRVHASDVLMV